MEAYETSLEKATLSSIAESKGSLANWKKLQFHRSWTLSIHRGSNLEAIESASPFLKGGAFM